MRVGELHAWRDVDAGDDQEHHASRLPSRRDRALFAARPTPPLRQVQIARGVPVTNIAAQLGHSRNSMTLHTYGHVLVDQNRGADSGQIVLVQNTSG
jgi:hypothetical protein